MRTRIATGKAEPPVSEATVDARNEAAELALGFRRIVVAVDMTPGAESGRPIGVFGLLVANEGGALTGMAAA